MVRKIGKLKTGTTLEQEQKAWAEVLSHRNKLLLISDWTQLPDSGLTDECIGTWRDWRQQLKNINRANFGDLALAEKAIGILSRRLPFNNYKPVDIEPNPEHCVSLDEYRRRVIRYMDDAFQQRMVPTFMDTPHLVEEQFKEATDFLTKGEGIYPILDTTAELYGMDKKTVADEFLARKVEQLKRLANLKQKYFYFQTLVTKATTDVQLAEVQAEVKQWISTST